MNYHVSYAIDKPTATVERMKEMAKRMVFPWTTATIARVADDVDLLIAVETYEQLNRAKEEIAILDTERNNLLSFVG